METRKYVVSGSGSYGELPETRREAKHSDDSVGRYHMRDPAMVSISVRPERYSYDIIKETGEFTINLVTEKLAFATDYCGVKSGRDVDKFKEMNLHACDGVNVSCPAIEESPVNVECKVKQVVELGSHHMFIAEVVGVQISDEYMDKTGKFNLNSTGLVAYSHGEYFALGDKLGKFGYSVRKK